MMTQIRTKRHVHFPRPKETKRVKHNYEHRMLTEGGRRIIMRRILKGCHILTH